MSTALHPVPAHRCKDPGTISKPIFEILVCIDEMPFHRSLVAVVKFPCEEGSQHQGLTWQEAAQL